MSEEGGVRTIGLPPQGVSTLRPGGSKPSQPPGKTQVGKDPTSISGDRGGSAPPLGAMPVRASASFAVDEETKLVTIKIVDADTGEVIRQIPPRDYIQLAVKAGNPKGTLFESRS